MDKGDQKAASHRRNVKMKRIIQTNLLTFVIILGVILGLITGIIVRTASQTHISEKDASYLGFPGEILIRMLKFIATPLIVTCIICALGSLNIMVSKTLCWQILLFLLCTKVTSVLIAMVLTAVIKPGKGGSDKSKNSTVELEQTTIPDIFLDMLRNLIPNNMVAVYVEQYKTKISPPEEYTDNTLLWQMEPSYQDSINLLGAICIAMVLGLCLTLMKHHSMALMDFTKSIYEIAMLVTTWILWTAPPFLFFLIMTEIMKIDDYSLYFSTWGLFVVTNLSAQMIIMIMVDPLILFFFTRTNPFKFYGDMVAAYMTAFGTASSLGTMPVLIECLLKHGVDERLVRFVVPIVVNINKDGAASYLGCAAVFVAQMENVRLSIPQYVGVFVLCCMGSVAAAGVPFSGPVVLLMILNGLGLDQSFIGTFLAIDWINDRGSTLCSVVSNSISVKLLEKWNRRLLKDLP